MPRRRSAGLLLTEENILQGTPPDFARQLPHRRPRSARPVMPSHNGSLPDMQGGVPVGEVSTARLWQEFKQSGDENARCQLIQRYAHLVSITAGRLFGPLPAGVERDDLIGAGVLGLVKAVDQFDPERGIKFETYAITLIRGAILEMLRGDDWVPRLIRDQQKQLKAAYMRLEARLGRPATEEEIAEELGISTEKLDKLLTNIGRSTLLSLDDLRLGSEQQRLADLLPTDAPSPLESVSLRERRRALAEAIDKLPERERTVVALYYHEGLTFKEIGQVLSVSESRAYQLHAQAVTRLRGYLDNEQELFP
ncbi:MAG: FliA/WhiG family RNA polymerase sigma factor [Chthonomonadaceae bacterium]|nr:FliA/WhiG family RNA polymerase sigma factor [Chthonomonadaceae bacterium]